MRQGRDWTTDHDHDIQGAILDIMRRRKVFGPDQSICHAKGPNTHNLRDANSAFCLALDLD